MTNYSRLKTAAEARKGHVNSQMTEAYDADEMERFRELDDVRIRLRDFIKYCELSKKFDTA